MPRIFTDTAGFTADRPWGAKDISLVEGASVRLHWTDQPYVWHVNDGAEVFVVLAGQVEMKYRQDGAEQTVLLGPGDIFAADTGDEHLACPAGEARVLVIERPGSL